MQVNDNKNAPTEIISLLCDREWWGSYSKTSISQSKSFTWPQFHRADRSFELNLHPGALNAGFHNFFLRPIFFRLELRAIYVIYHNDDEKYLNLEKSRIQFFYIIISFASPSDFHLVLSMYSFHLTNNRSNGSAKFAISRMKTVCKNEKKKTLLHICARN